MCQLKAKVCSDTNANIQVAAAHTVARSNERWLNYVTISPLKLSY